MSWGPAEIRIVFRLRGKIKSICNQQLMTAVCSFSIFPVHAKQALRAPLCLWASFQPSRSQVLAHPLHPTYPPGDSVSAWTSVYSWQLQMLLTAVKLRGSSSHSKVQMFLFFFSPRFERRRGIPLGMIGTRFVVFFSLLLAYLCGWIFVNFKWRIIC